MQSSLATEPCRSDVVTTKLWILEPREDLPADDNPWEPWFNRCFGIIVEAATEDRARAIAHENCTCKDQWILRDKRAFIDPRYTTCTELRPSGQDRFVMATFEEA